MNFCTARFASRLAGVLACFFTLFFLSACSSFQLGSTAADSLKVASATKSRFLKSGTIILSHALPSEGSGQIQSPVVELASNSEAPAGRRQNQAKPKIFAPLIGYFPPAHAYLPADNETWLEVDSRKKKLTLFKGKSAIKEIAGEGDVSIGEGDYYLQHKQKQPLWYAPDDYFTKRKLNVPGAGDRLRYRRGALGSYALYPTTTFPIHCGPVWSSDVGGLRVSAAELSSIYYMLPVGAPIVVK